MRGIGSIDVREKLTMLLLDMIIILLAYMGSHKIVALLHYLLQGEVLLGGAMVNVLPPFLIFPLMIYIFELYKTDRWHQNVRLILLILTAMVTGSGLMVVSEFMFPEWLVLERMTLILHILLSTMLLFIIRKTTFNRALTKDSNKNIILIGNHELLGEIFSLLRSTYSKHYTSLSWIKPWYEQPDNCVLFDPDTGEDLSSLIKKNDNSTIVLSNDLVSIPQIKDILPTLRLSGARVYDPFNYYETLTNKVAVHHIEHSWFLFHNQGVSFNPRIYLKIKKVLEMAIAFCLLIVLLPLLALISLTILIFDGLPVLFCQERIGQKEKLFTLYKFRSMQKSAHSSFIPAWQKTKLKQSAITPLGCFLRRTRLDELPQLLNILRGDMSFIGPRPIRPHAVDILQKEIPFYSWRLAVKPGLTGWAQVCAGYGDSLEGQIEKLQYDLYYIQNQSVILDLLIIVKTVRSILFLQGK